RHPAPPLRSAAVRRALPPAAPRRNELRPAAMSLLGQAAVFLFAAVVAVPLFRRLRLSSILAYLIAGAALGPWGLGAIEDVEATMRVSELGVVLLLFVIGLELRSSRLRVVRRSALRLGVPQLLVTSAVLAAAGLALGLPARTAFLA